MKASRFMNFLRKAFVTLADSQKSLGFIVYKDDDSHV
jgi:hypothetical protein